MFHREIIFMHIMHIHAVYINPHYFMVRTPHHLGHYRYNYYLYYNYKFDFDKERT